MTTLPSRPVTLALAALGGQGGGVVSDWLVAAARRSGWIAQATSVPGVAQRTGATIYYLEFFPASALAADGREPIMALMPCPGDVDIVVASELAEAGRAAVRGLITPDRTTVICSTHRDYTIAEKMAPGDGRMRNSEVTDTVTAASKRMIAFDMAAAANRSGGRISAVLLGAIAGSDVLPFALESYHDAIREAGIAVEQNIDAFTQGLNQARQNGAAQVQDNAPEVPTAPELPAQLAKRIGEQFPQPLRPVLATAAGWLIGYQDERYAGEFLDRLLPIARIDATAGNDHALSLAVARGLALWMCFEDTIRVADVKLSAERLQNLRSQSRVGAGELLQVSEFLKPRVEEILGTLPAGLALALQRRAAFVDWFARHAEGRQIRSDTVSGFLLLRVIAAMRRWRRRTLRYRQETARMNAWLEQVVEEAQRNYPLAVELAANQRLVKGYGDTHERGWQHFELLALEARRIRGRPDAARRISLLRAAALSDDNGASFRNLLHDSH
ncbi:MAG: indolepyruvate oxidoreductase subunit beta family protein [Steroidobacteraceae bacterium]